MSKFVFIDNIGRTIVSELVSDTGGVLTVKNPAMINVSQLQSGQLQVQLIPLFFSEFISEAKRTTGTVWAFNKNSVVVPVELELDTKLVDQYTKIFTPNVFEPEKVSESVVKLFDDV
jgi:hypothetical protein